MLERRSQHVERASSGAFLEGGSSGSGRSAPVTHGTFGQSFGEMDSGRAGLKQRGRKSRKAAPEQDDMMANAVLGKKD